MCKRLTLSLMMLTLVVSCSSHDSTPTGAGELITDSSCTLFSPLYTHGQDAQLMDIRTVRQINAHNDLWLSLCGGENK